MAISLSSITTGRAAKPPRIILLGVEKIGKSTFAADAPSPIFIPIKGEEGIDDLETSKFPVARSYSDVLDSITSLYQEKHEYRTAIIDSASTLEPLIWDHTCRSADKVQPSIEAFGYGKGYVEATKYWREIMDGCDALRDDRGMGSIIIGHVKVKLFTDPMADPYDTYLFDVNERASNALFRWADCILFANVKTVVKQADVGMNKKKARGVGDATRVLLTQKRPAHPGGGRGAYGQIPYELPMSYQAFSEAVANAQSQQMQPVATNNQ